VNMNLLVKLSLVSIFFLPANAGWAGTQQESVAIEQPPAKTTEPWQITVGGPWLAGVSGTTGFHGTNSNVRDTNFLYQLSLHGAQITVGLKF
jgi:hypothetical protein